MNLLSPHKKPVIVNLYDMNGMSKAKIAHRMGCSVNTVRKVLKEAGVLSRKPATRPFVMFNGRKYAEEKDGYWRATNRPRTMLHRDVFEFHMQRSIKPGHEINHKDHCKWNNDFSNLQELPKPEHGAETNHWHRNKGSNLPAVVNDDIPF